MSGASFIPQWQLRGSLPSEPWRTVAPHQAPHTSYRPQGTKATIHGSGFEPTTTPSANGSPTTVTFVDPDSLKIIMPGVASGPVQVTVSNQSGQAYSLDSAFVV